MTFDVAADAEQCLQDACGRFGLTISASQRSAARDSVVAQSQMLSHTGQATHFADTQIRQDFAKPDVSGALAQGSTLPRLSLADAQARYGCFSRLFDVGQGGAAMPVVVKDIFRFDMHHPTVGLENVPQNLALPSAPVIKRLRQAGANIVATSKLSAWCYLPLEFNEQVTPPTHPWGGDLMVGGSSSGSAVAVASGAVPVAIGSDTGGSIRIPAALCGIYGYKPSAGGITTAGAVPLGETQDTIGILAQEPHDLRAVFDVLTSVPNGSKPDRTALRFSVPAQSFSTVDVQHRRAQAVLQSRLVQLGHTVSAAVDEIALDRMNAAASLITGFEAARYHGPRLSKHPGDYPGSILKRLLVGLAVSQDVYHSALAERAALIEYFHTHVFAQCDFILFPVVARHGYKTADWGRPADPDAIGKISLELLSLNRWVNLLGLPTVSVPIQTDGAPAAVQIVGRADADHELLQLICEVGKLRL